MLKSVIKCGFAAVLCLCVFAKQSFSAGAIDPQLNSYVEASDQFLNILKSTAQSTEPFSVRAEKLRVAIEERFDYKYVAQLTFGSISSGSLSDEFAGKKVWNLASDEQKKQFMDVTLRYMATSMADRFNKAINITPAQNGMAQAKSVTIRYNIVKSDSTTITLDFSFKKPAADSNEVLKVADMRAQGASETLVRSQENSSFIKNHIKQNKEQNPTKSEAELVSQAIDALIAEVEKLVQKQYAANPN